MSKVDPNIAHPNIDDFMKSDPSILLNIRLNIKGCLPINGMNIELAPNKEATYEHPKMPGTNGPTPHFSSFPRTLEVVDDGFFIDSKGSKEWVGLRHGCWELNWRNGHPTGTIVCGFDLQKEAKRNNVVLPSGCIYLAFPVFSKESLAVHQVEKSVRKAKARAYFKEKEIRLVSFRQTTNTRLKAKCYSNYIRALDRYDKKQKLVEAISRLVPDDVDAIAIDDDVVLMSQGTVWTNNDPAGANSGISNVLLGSAEARLTTIGNY